MNFFIFPLKRLGAVKGAKVLSSSYVNTVTSGGVKKFKFKQTICCSAYQTGIKSGVKSTVNFYNSSNKLLTSNKTNIKNIMPDRSMAQKSTSVYIPVSFLGTAVGKGAQVYVTYTFQDSTGNNYQGTSNKFIPYPS
jgi:hypothetical protein